MRAMTVTKYGGPEVLKLADVPKPEPGDDDVLIEVHAAGMNPVDFKIRQAPRWGEREFPFILGYDCSGVIAACGKNVRGFRAGEAVYCSPAISRDGSNAEFVCVDYRLVSPKPESLDHVQAAGVPLALLTAWESLHDHGHIAKGDTVLVHAGGGGVGHFGVQLAKLAGARVITTASRPETIDLCRKLGADVVINHREEDVVERVKKETSDAKCDIVFDTVGGEVFDESIKCVGLFGRLVTIVPGFSAESAEKINSLFAKSASLHLEYMGLPGMFGVARERQAGVLRNVAQMLDAGELKVHVSETFPLEKLADAHELQASGKAIGKIVVTVK